MKNYFKNTLIAAFMVLSTSAYSQSMPDSYIHRASGLVFKNTESGWKMTRILDKETINTMISSHPQQEITDPLQVHGIDKIYSFWKCHNSIENTEKCVDAKPIHHFALN